MQIRQLTDQLSVSPQLGLEDIAQVAAAGFRGLINNRPDGEAAGQPTSAQLADAAARHGLAYRYVPVVPGRFDPETIGAMASALDALPPPVLAFCRTGTRSTSMWALQACRHTDAQALLETARAAGYDLDALAPQLRAGQGT